MSPEEIRRRINLLLDDAAEREGAATTAAFSYYKKTDDVEGGERMLQEAFAAYAAETSIDELSRKARARIFVRDKRRAPFPSWWPKGYKK